MTDDFSTDTIAINRAQHNLQQDDQYTYGNNILIVLVYDNEINKNQ